MSENEYIHNSSLTVSEAELLEEKTGRTVDQFEAWVESVWLSPRELLVIWLKQEGDMSPGDIASELEIDTSTVHSYLNRISEKFEKSDDTYQLIDEREIP